MTGGKVVVALVTCALFTSPAAAAPVQQPGGHYYEYVGDQTTWSAAQSYATARHAQLATVGSVSENTFVDGLVNSAPAWIGGTDQTVEGTWAWVTGEPFTYTNWAAGQPDDGVAGEDALAMSPDGTWLDSDGTYTGFVGGFVMEWTDDQPDLDGDGLYGNEDPDDDNDGTPDSGDACPLEASSLAGGCPGTAEPGGSTPPSDGSDPSGTGDTPSTGDDPPVQAALTVVRLADRFTSRNGASLRFVLNTAASVKVVARGSRKGRRKGQRCDPAARSGQRCTIRFKPVTTTVQGVAGSNTVAFGRGLRRGSYRVSLTATRPGGLPSLPVVLRFTVR